MGKEAGLSLSISNYMAFFCETCKNKRTQGREKRLRGVTFGFDAAAACLKNEKKSVKMKVSMSSRRNRKKGWAEAKDE